MASSFLASHRLGFKLWFIQDLMPFFTSANSIFFFQKTGTDWVFTARRFEKDGSTANRWDRLRTESVWRTLGVNCVSLEFFLPTAHLSPDSLRTLTMLRLTLACAPMCLIGCGAWTNERHGISPVCHICSQLTPHPFKVIAYQWRRRCRGGELPLWPRVAKRTREREH